MKGTLPVTLCYARRRLWRDQFAMMNLLNEVAQHRLRDLEVGDDPVLHGPDGDDVSRTAAEHPLGIIADGENLICASPYSYHRGLAEHDAVILYVDESVRGAEIDPDVIGKYVSEKSFKH